MPFGPHLKVVALVALTAMAVPCLPAQTWLLDPAFTPEVTNNAADGAIARLEADAAGRVLVAGAFTHITGMPRPGLARFLADGTVDRNFAPPANATWLLLPPDGRLIVSIGGAVRRLRDDGAIDSTFAFPAGLDPKTTRWLLGAPDGRLLISAFEPDDKQEKNLKLIWLAADGARLTTLATEFAHYGIYTPPHLEIIPGPPDPTGMPVVNFGTTWVPGSLQPVNRITRARSLPDGRLVVAGGFQQVNDRDRLDVVWLRPDGAVAPSPADPPIVDGQVAPARAFQVNYAARPAFPLSDGRVIRLELSTSGAVPSTSKFTRLLPDGTVDPAFHPPGANLGSNTLLLADDSIFSEGQRFLSDGWPDPHFAPRVRRRSVNVPLTCALRHVDGSLWVGGAFDELDGQSRRSLARYLPRDIAAITTQPAGQNVVAGREAFLRVTLGTSQPASIQWLRDGVPVPGAATTMLEFRPARVDDSGSYRARITLGDRVLTSEPAQVVVTPNTTRLVNFSALAQLEPDVPLVAGWISDAPATRTVLLRAIGRGLAPGNTSLLAAPVLSLYRADQLLARDSGSAADAPMEALARSVGAFAVRLPSAAFPSINPGAALTPTLEAGVFTAVVASGDGTRGVGLFELYDTARNSDTPGMLRNVSVLGPTSVRSTLLTVGFVVSGNGPLRVLVRGLGPALSAFGIAEPLPDPRLSVRGRRHWVENIGSAAEIATATRAAGAFALAADGGDSVTLLELEPDDYIAELYSSSARAGRGMIEIYVLRP